MTRASLILLVSLGPATGAAAQSQANGKVVPVVALAAADLAPVAASTLRQPVLPSAGPASLVLAGAAIRPQLVFGKRISVPTTRTVLTRLGASLAKAGRGWNAGATTAEPIAAAMDGSGVRAARQGDESFAVPPARDASPAATFTLAPAHKEAMASLASEPRVGASGPRVGASEPPSPAAAKPWKTKAKAGLSIGSGWTLLALGIVLWILPIPGPTALLLGGLALLAPHYAWAARLQLRILAATAALAAAVAGKLRRLRRS